MPEREQAWLCALVATLVLAAGALVPTVGCRKSSRGPATATDAEAGLRAPEATPAVDTVAAATDVGTPDRAAPPETSSDPVAVPGTGAASGPAIASFGDGWLVAWQEDGGGSSRVMAGVVDPAGHVGPTQAVSPGGDDGGVRLAVNGDHALAVWHSAADDGAVGARPLGRDGAPQGEPLVLSGEGLVGAPEVLASGDGFVAAWLEAGKLAAVLLDAKGAVLRRGAWPGGGPRPPAHGGPGDSPPSEPAEPPDPEWAAPDLARPRLQRDGEDVVAVWTGAIWMSDDNVGHGFNRLRLAWDDPGQAPVQESEYFSVVVLGATRLVSGEAVQLEQWREDPYEGPWELYVRGADGARRISSEREGPLRAVFSETAPNELLVAWPSPTFGGYRFLRDARGEAREGFFPSGVAPGFGAVALAVGPATNGGQPAVRAAWVDTQDGRTVIRVADPERLTAERPGEPAVARPAHFPGSRGSIGWIAAARTSEGKLGVAWDDAMSGKRVRAAWVHEGDPGTPAAPEILEAGDPELYCEGVRSAVDGATLWLGFTCCPPEQFCITQRPYAAVWLPGERLRPSPLAASGGIYDLSTLVREGAHAAVAMVRHEGTYSQLAVRRTDAEASVDALQGLAGAADIDLPGAIGDHLAGVSGCFVAETLVLAWTEPAIEGDGRCRLARVGADGSVEPGVEFPEPLTVYSDRRIAQVGDGLALLGTRRRAGEIELVVRWLDARAERVQRTTVLARDVLRVGPSLAASADGIAVSWHEERSGGVWLAAAPAGAGRLAGPVRLDDPTSRTVYAGTSLVDAATPGAWRVFWNGPWDGAYAVHTDVRTP
ncbi:MAG: hypothetical protein HY907_00470 [Deltaproteobacteria bacterium]|nr:hypothetical protein [Deltaproteobacteria bacterium]